MHAICTALLHEGIWHLTLSCLLKSHQPAGAPKKPGLTSARCVLDCPVHWQRLRSDRSTAHPIQVWCCKVRACQWTDSDQRKGKEKRLRGFIMISFCSWTLLILSLLIPAFLSCQGWGLHWQAAEWKHTKSLAQFAKSVLLSLHLCSLSCWWMESAQLLKGNEPSPPPSFQLVCWMLQQDKLVQVNQSTYWCGVVVLYLVYQSLAVPGNTGLQGKLNHPLSRVIVQGRGKNTWEFCNVICLSYFLS